MDSKELLSQLVSEGVNPLIYRLEAIDGGEGQDNCYRLRRSGQAWEVCYLERGSYRTLGTFATETAACDDLFARIDKEVNARSHLLAWFSEKSKADELVATLLQAGIKPTHRDASAFANQSDIRYRVFVDGRDLEAAGRMRDRHAAAKTG